MASIRRVLEGGGILLALTLLACWLRLPAHDAGLPHRGEPDTFVVTQVEGLEARGLLSRHDAGWKYPLLTATLAASVPPFQPAPADPKTLEEHLAAASHLHAHVRLVVALLSALLAPATYLLARSFLTRRWAALAGVLAAASLLHLCFSWQARPHAPAAVATTLALVACLRFARDPRAGNGVLLGLGCGAAVATLHTGFLVLAPLGAALALALRARGRQAFVPGAIALALLTAAALWGYLPGERVLAERAEAAAQPIEIPDGALRFWGHTVPLDVLDGGGFARVAAALWSYDPVLLVLGLVGLGLAVAGLRRRSQTPRDVRTSGWILASYALPALAVYGLYGWTPPRFVLAFVPLLALLAAAAVARSDPLLGRTARGFLVALAVLLTALPAQWAMELRTRPDTVERAAAWIEDRCLPGSEAPDFLCLNLLSLPLFQLPGLAHPDAAWLGSPWSRYTARIEREDGGATAARLGFALRYPSAQELSALLRAEDRQAAAADLVDAYDADRVLLATSTPPALGGAYERGPTAELRAALLAAGYELTETIEASRPDGPDVELAYQATLPMVLRARSMGPRIEIWHRSDGER